jgi:hypothetical protein
MQKGNCLFSQRLWLIITYLLVFKEVASVSICFQQAISTGHVSCSGLQRPWGNCDALARLENLSAFMWILGRCVRASAWALTSWVLFITMKSCWNLWFNWHWRCSYRIALCHVLCSHSVLWAVALVSNLIPKCLFMGHRFLCGQVLHVASPKLCVCDILFIIYVLICAIMSTA